MIDLMVAITLLAIITVVAMFTVFVVIGGILALVGVALEKIATIITRRKNE